MVVQLSCTNCGESETRTFLPAHSVTTRRDSQTFHKLYAVVGTLSARRTNVTNQF
jgi:hypothetical protein